MTGELERLFLAVEDTLGIKADEGALEKFREYLAAACGSSREEPGVLARAFSSGEAADFLTINETYFFREPAHFYFLRNRLSSLGGGIRICSAATSTGCEAYSIAAVLEQYKRENPPVSYHIDAFDINPRVIETAERGLYGMHSLREDGRELRHLLDPYLEKQEKGYRVDPSLQNNIRFFVHNILNPLPEGTYDFIFFRNAFIYFSPRHRVKILSNLALTLKEGGLLIMGVSETAGVSHPSFDEQNQDGIFYFRKSPAVEAGLRGTAEVYGDPFFSGTAPSTGPGGRDPAEGASGSGVPGKRRPGKIRDLHIEAPEVGKILAGEEEAAELAERILQTPDGEQFGGNELAAAALFLLNRGDFAGTGRILGFMEEQDDLSFTAFLRGEYFYFQDMFTEAEFQYKISLGKNAGFWPASYRLSFLACTGVLQKYRAGQALESLGRSRELHYEVFIGGFSPDYYQGTLLKQNTG
jgi:chemotaxis protein methyltransferase CheR